MNNTKQLLLSQIRMYLALARSLRSRSYLARAKSTMGLLKQLEDGKTLIMGPEELPNSALAEAMKEAA